MHYMRNKTPSISVIVPIYNSDKYLQRCIDSILSQDFEDFELLLIDDGSTDNSGDICDKYAEKDMRVRVFHKKNGGVSSARNLGIENAKGEWVVFIDSDDWVDITMLEKLYKNAVVTLNNSMFLAYNPALNFANTENFSQYIHLKFEILLLIFQEVIQHYDVIY